MEKESRRADVRQDRPGSRDFFSLAGPHGAGSSAYDDLGDAGIELKFAAGFFQTSQQRLRDRPRSADGYPETGRGCQPGQDETAPRTQPILGTHVNVKRQA